MTTNTTQKMTDDQLTAKAAKGQADAQAAAAEQVRRERERVAAAEAAALAKAQVICDTWEQHDADLMAKAKLTEATFNKAIRERDLSAAVFAWADHRATRYARARIRTEAQSAHWRVTGRESNISALSLIDADLISWIEKAADLDAGDAGYALGAELLGLEE